MCTSLVDRCYLDTLGSSQHQFTMFAHLMFRWLRRTVLRITRWLNWDASSSTPRSEALVEQVNVLTRTCVSQAGGESLILKEMFQAPLEGRPSDNGVANAQLYYQSTRPYEGLPRIHYPSKTHMVGCKFASTSVATMADSGVNSPMKLSKAMRAA